MAFKTYRLPILETMERRNYIPSLVVIDNIIDKKHIIKTCSQM